MWGRESVWELEWGNKLSGHFWCHVSSCEATRLPCSTVQGPEPVGGTVIIQPQEAKENHSESWKKEPGRWRTSFHSELSSKRERKRKTEKERVTWARSPPVTFAETFQPSENMRKSEWWEGSKSRLQSWVWKAALMGVAWEQKPFQRNNSHLNPSPSSLPIISCKRCCGKNKRKERKDKPQQKPVIRGRSISAWRERWTSLTGNSLTSEERTQDPLPW